MTTIENGNLKCLVCGEKHPLKAVWSMNDSYRKYEAFKVLHEDCAFKSVAALPSKKDLIIESVEIYTGVCYAEMRSATQREKVVSARKMLCSIMKEQTSMSKVAIAELVERRLQTGLGDGAIVSHYIKKDADHQITNPAYAKKRKMITDRIRNRLSTGTTPQQAWLIMWGGVNCTSLASR